MYIKKVVFLVIILFFFLQRPLKWTARILQTNTYIAIEMHTNSHTRDYAIRVALYCAVGGAGWPRPDSHIYAPYRDNELKYIHVKLCTRNGTPTYAWKASLYSLYTPLYTGCTPLSRVLRNRLYNQTYIYFLYVFFLCMRISKDIMGETKRTTLCKCVCIYSWMYILAHYQTLANFNTK